MACGDVWNTWHEGIRSPQNFAVGFCGDQRPKGHWFQTSQHAMIKTYYSTSIMQNYDKKNEINEKKICFSKEIIQ